MTIIKTIASRSAPVTAANRGIARARVDEAATASERAERGTRRLMTSAVTGQKAAALTATLGVAAASWVHAVERMGGMNMGVATTLGSFGFFVALWAPMMAANDASGAATGGGEASGNGPGHARHAVVTSQSYRAVWTCIGVVVYALYRPYGTLSRRRGRDRCGDRTSSRPLKAPVSAGADRDPSLRTAVRGRVRGLEHRADGARSSVAVERGEEDIAWMSVIAAVVVAQKLLPANAAIDLPVAAAIVGLVDPGPGGAIRGARTHANDVTQRGSET